ncbi:hypothetical protein [Clostridium perfringens]|uniref:hypothetical protein n=1 Tax=Clostridium perfringens TaxID=1502 RepID=UPI001CAD6BFC|nr:hypothetical protein [Clostridium perfringens]EJT5929276.1 hypothetical protein [Clostridium perfringens]EJT6484048.1 hypothetical protein [Clostridium perfringens]MDK0584183.1 hypothetical protein [Clostridium perfringens]HBI6967676.1 hypothetical protein [Clostridium perfringens]
MFNKGDIVFYHGVNGRETDRAKSGAHLWVILHSYTHPLNTILMVPITSNQGFPNTSVKLDKSNYLNILEHDSYLDFRSICVANTENIRFTKGLDSNNKHTIKLEETPRLTDIDIIRSDLAAMQALEVGDTVKGLVEKKGKELLDTYKDGLNKEFSDVSNKIVQELDKIDDESVRNLILAILDKFKEQFK